MSYILIMILLDSSGITPVATQNIKFQSNAACLEALGKLINMERNFKVKAVCVKST